MKRRGRTNGDRKRDGDYERGERAPSYCTAIPDAVGRARTDGDGSTSLGVAMSPRCTNTLRALSPGRSTWYRVMVPQRHQPVRSAQARALVLGPGMWVTGGLNPGRGASWSWACSR